MGIFWLDVEGSIQFLEQCRITRKDWISLSPLDTLTSEGGFSHDPIFPTMKRFSGQGLRKISAFPCG